MTELGEAWATVVAEGDTETVAGKAFLPLIELESGTVFGLTEEAEGLLWARQRGAELTAFDASAPVSFIEALEQPRRDFESRIEQSAAGKGLPGLETAWSFPALELLKAMMKSETQHFVRLALNWILPTDLRDLRADLKRVAEREELPQDLHDFAVHLCVPE